MCGICGALYFSEHRRHHEVESMLEKLQHRGPDYQTVKEYGSVVLGHARLKIIDTSNQSNQPFESGNARQAIVYNGECYNFSAIRDNLKEKGIPFDTQGDTEVLFKQVNHHGVDGLKDINGMFAFGHWDAEKQTLTLARDRLGIKPLYYLKTQHAFYFASEFRALLPVAGENSVDRSAVAEYLAFQANLGEDTLHKHIKKLEPGRFLKITSNAETQLESYYQLDEVFENRSAEIYSPDELQKCFFQSVEKRLISDVPLGAFLSGGVDSTAIVAAMNHLGANPVKTFTLGFEDRAYDERSYARKVAQKFATDHQEVVLTEKEILSHIRDAVKALDQPSGDAINTYLVSKYTKEAGLTVALSGLGGDELFGGYPSARAAKLFGYITVLRYLSPKLRRSAADLLLRSSTNQTEKIKEIISGSLKPAAIVRTLRRVLNNHQLKCLGLPEHDNKTEMNSKGATNGQNEAALNELFAYTIPLLLKDTDQTSMAHSLEVRVPFLDHRFVEYTAKFPNELRNPSGSFPKSAFVEAMEPLIPTEIYDRPKRGFVLPMNRWMRNELKAFTRSGLFDSPLRHVLSESTVEEYWQSFLATEDPQQITWSRIWTLSVLGHWMNNTGLRS